MFSRFPKDRINNFCDAVFAIAMTLLILEIKIPADEFIREYGTLTALRQLLPNFLGFFITFLVTAVYWRSHLRLAQYIKEYDNRLLWLTIFLLLFVVLLPFSTALYSQSGNYNGPFVFYCLNLVAIGLLNYFMVRYVVRNQGYDETLTRPRAALLKVKAISAPLVWAIAAVWVLVEPISARFMFLLIFAAIPFIERRFKGKV